jgi:translation initiation factor IF-3
VTVIATEKTRINNEIRCPEVLLIDANGKQVGVMSPQEALKHAEEQGLDLVEVAPKANPPVCRIMDYGKFKYQQRKKAQESRKKKLHSITTVKEIKLRPRTEEHDLYFKVRNLKKFLANRNKIKVSLQFRGREIAHIDLGEKMMARIMEEIKDIGIIEQGPKLEGRFMTMVVAPKP